MTLLTRAMIPSIKVDMEPIEKTKFFRERAIKSKPCEPENWMNGLLRSTLIFS